MSGSRTPTRVDPAKQAPLIQLQCDVISLISLLKDGRMKYVLNIIDRFTKYTIQEALERETQDACAQVIIDFVESVRELSAQGDWPWDTTLLCDNGASFGASFKQQIEAHEPKIEVVNSEAGSQTQPQSSCRSAGHVFQTLKIWNT